MDAFISGSWRNVRRAEVYLGGAWRRLVRSEVYINGAWRSCASFTSPLTVLAQDVYGSNSNNGKPIIVTSDISQSTPSGGIGPYSYSWTILSGGAVPNTPTMSATSFRQTLAAGASSTSTARVTCTDALGAVATRDISIVLSNEGIL
jgi:hypothetical protein